MITYTSKSILDNELMKKIDNIKTDFIYISPDIDLLVLKDNIVIGWYMGGQTIDSKTLSEDNYQILISNNKVKEVEWGYARDNFGISGKYSFRILITKLFFEESNYKINSDYKNYMKNKFKSIIESSLTQSIKLLNINSNNEVIEKVNKEKIEKMVFDSFKMKLLLSYGIELVDFTVDNIRENLIKQKPKEKPEIDENYIMW